MAAGTALAVTSLLPGTLQASHQPTAPLAAWTVATQPDGTVRVTIPRAEQSGRTATQAPRR